MRFGIIGAGNMGLSLVKGILKKGIMSPEEILISDLDERKLEEAEKLGVGTTRDNLALARDSDVILIAVKPNAVRGLLEEIGEALDDKLLISIAAGIPTSFIEERTKARVIRIMPNLCAAVGEMVACYSLGSGATPADEKLVKDIFEKLGTLAKVDENLMDAATGLGGSGPAYFFRLIQAAAEAGVELGIPRNLALLFAAQIAKGAGAMASESEENLSNLIQKICTPGGTTIEGMKILDEKKAAEALKDAIKAAARRSKELSG
jgi:pyrroline-5-carboxylate reductase